MQVSFEISRASFDLDETLGCGQVLRWRKEGNYWYGVVRDTVIKASQQDGRVRITQEPEPRDPQEMRTYFGLDHNLNQILHMIAKDETIRHAIEGHRGLRIIRQDPWECLVSYVCATFKNIPAIQKMLDAIARRLGRRLDFEGRTYHTLPMPAELAKATAAELHACGAGFRAKCLIACARAVNSGNVDLSTLRELPFEDARSCLLGREAEAKLLPGVGPKVADCVLLFSLSKLEAFPIDVWISRALTQYYGGLLAGQIPSAEVEKLRRSQPLSPRQYELVSRIMREYYGKYAGYAQEYLYAHVRGSKHGKI